MLRDHGMPRKYHHDVIGRNDRIDAIQAAVLSAKLPHLDRWNQRRREHAERYNHLLGGTEGITLFTKHEQCEHNYHLFIIRVPQRDEVQKKLTERGISSGIHYPIPIHKQRAFTEHWGEQSFPVSERLAAEILSLPMYAELKDGQVEEVCEVMKAILISL